MQMHEDLATLFSRNLNLHSTPYPEPVQETPITQTTKPEQAITYSITQHYHHSAHLASQQPSRPASVPNTTDQQTTEIILARHGVDASTLFPTQIELFKMADASQQMRLVELWRISPPNYGGHALAQDLGNWPQTSLQQEEAMAKLRYEQQMLEERASRIGNVEPQQGSEDVMSDEPYMTSGYEALAQRDYNIQARQPTKDVYSHFGTSVGGPTYKSATDPAYKNIDDIHRYPNTGSEMSQQLEKQQEMENRYGAFQENYNYGYAGCPPVHGDEDEEML